MNLATLHWVTRSAEENSVFRQTKHFQGLVRHAESFLAAVLGLEEPMGLGSCHHSWHGYSCQSLGRLCTGPSGIIDIDISSCGLVKDLFCKAGAVVRTCPIKDFRNDWIEIVSDLLLRDNFAVNIWIRLRVPPVVPIVSLHVCCQVCRPCPVCSQLNSGG